MGDTGHCSGNVVYVHSPSFSLRSYDSVILEITRILKSLVGRRAGCKIQLDIVVLEKDVLSVEGGMSHLRGRPFGPLLMGCDMREGLDNLLLRLYHHMHSDEHTAQWNKARLIFDVRSARVCLAYRWDDDFSWFARNHACAPTNMLLGDDSILEIFSWSGLSRCHPRPWMALSTSSRSARFYDAKETKRSLGNIVE